MSVRIEASGMFRSPILAHALNTSVESIPRVVRDFSIVATFFAALGAMLVYQFPFLCTQITESCFIDST